MTDYVDITPDTNLLRALRAEGPVNYVLLIGEGIDNAFDADARRIEITIDAEEIRFRDNGNGILKKNQLAIFQVGKHAPGPGTVLGRFGIGMTQQAMSAGDVLEAASISADGAMIARVNWRDVLHGPKWQMPKPRWQEVAGNTPTGTEVIISALQDIPSFSEDKILEEIALRFHPALATGKEIIFQGNGVHALPEPQMTDIVDATLKFDGQRQAHVHAGILVSDSPLRKVHVEFGHRVLIAGESFGVGSYGGISRMFARVRLSSSGWKLGKFKDQLSSATQKRELEEALQDVLLPILEKVHNERLDERLERIVVELNDLIPEEFAAARPHRKGKTDLPSERPKRKNSHGNPVAEDKADLSGTGPARTKRLIPARFLIDFEDGYGRHSVGYFDGAGSPHRVILFADNPVIANLRAARERHQVASVAMYLQAVNIYAASLAIAKASGPAPEFPNLDGTFGERVAKLMALVQERLCEKVPVL